MSHRIQSKQPKRADYYQKRFRILRILIDYRLRTGRKESARRLLERIQVNLLEESQSYWRDWLLRKINKFWGVLLDGRSSRRQRGS